MGENFFTINASWGYEKINFKFNNSFEFDNSLVKMKHFIGKCVCLFIFTESGSCTSSSTLWDGLHQAIYDDLKTSLEISTF